MRYTTLGLPLPDAGDCAACVFGNDHNSECVGVDFGGERVYYSGMPSVIDQSRDLIRGVDPMNSKHNTTNTVDEAARRIPDSVDYATELRNLLNRAVAEAFEDELYWSDSGKPHLRTFLNTTPVGIAIVELANAILEDNPPCPFTHAHTRHWCGNNACRDS